MDRKKHSWILVLLTIVSAILSSCEEVGPPIDLTDDVVIDTTYVADQVESPQVKNVILEEFTGVRCTNCPQGHELLDDLETQHGARFIAISNHSELLAAPYDDDQDLRVPDAQALEDFLGPISAKPSGSIDRKLFSGEISLINFMQKWANYVNQQLSLTTPVNIHIETDLNSSNRDLDIVVTLHYTQEVLEENKLTILLMEDSIITQQFDHGTLDSAYTQNRVLRDVITSTNGEAISTTKEAGRVVVKGFRLENMPAIWNTEQLRVVALVHYGGTSKEVLQAVQKEVD